MRRHYSFLLASLGLGLSVVTGAHWALANENTSANRVVARINGQIITLEEFNRRYQENSKFFGLQPPSKKDFLEDLIKRELAIQEARKQNLHQDPEIADRMNTVLFQGLIERQLGPQVEMIFINDREAEQYYKKNPEIRTSHILISVPAGADQERIARAKKETEDILMKQIRTGKMTFAEAAQRFSQGPSAPMGGDIDYKTQAELPEEYYAAAQKLRKVGDVSGVIRSALGFHIIQLTGRRSWDEVNRAHIKKILIEQRQKELFDNYIKGLRSKSQVQVNESLIN
jgi:parvulin-like peptidyl-prolyl isomerase